MKANCNLCAKGLLFRNVPAETVRNACPPTVPGVWIPAVVEAGPDALRVVPEEEDGGVVWAEALEKADKDGRADEVSTLDRVGLQEGGDREGEERGAKRDPVRLGLGDISIATRVRWSCYFLLSRRFKRAV